MAHGFHRATFGAYLAGGGIAVLLEKYHLSKNTETPLSFEDVDFNLYLLLAGLALYAWGGVTNKFSENKRQS